MASLYQARKQGVPLPPLPPSMLASVPPTSVKKEGNGSHYDAATVEQIKAQFQAQIEAMMLSQVRNCLPCPLCSTVPSAHHYIMYRSFMYLCAQVSMLGFACFFKKKDLIVLGFFNQTYLLKYLHYIGILKMRNVV